MKVVEWAGAVPKREPHPDRFLHKAPCANDGFPKSHALRQAYSDGRGQRAAGAVG